MLIPLREAYKGRAYGIIRAARFQDIKRLRWISCLIQNPQNFPNDVSVLEILRTGDDHQCPNQISEMLRNYLWSKEIIGVTYPCPVDQLKFILPTHS